MSDNAILVEILHAVGELKQQTGGLLADNVTVKGAVGDIKADIAQMKAQPAKKRAERLAMLGGFLGFASLVLTALKLFAH
jgi:hypothetical protein